MEQGHTQTATKKLILCSYPHIRITSDTLCAAGLGIITMIQVHMAANWENDILQAVESSRSNAVKKYPKVIHD